VIFFLRRVFLGRVVLGTDDAHSLYEQFGFIRDNGMYKPPIIKEGNLI